MFIKNKIKRKRDNENFVVSYDPTSAVSEQYRIIRTNIHFSTINQKLKTLLITGPISQSGKTTTTLNLATAFASEGLKVLTVSSDLRKPVTHKILGLSNEKGLTSLLAYPGIGLETMVIPSSIENLYHLLSGPVPPNPTELLNSDRMEEIIEEMKALYDLVIFDSPPLLAVADAQVLSSKVDGTIVVVPQGQVTKKEIKEAAERLSNVQANVIGVILNKVKRENDHYYYSEIS